MRTIKFRAWGMSKTMRSWEELKGLHVSTIFSKSVGYHIMQFTGLLDKNGKEIYEGDIVKVWDINRGGDCEDEVDGKEPVEGEHRDDCECYVTTQKIEWAPWGGYHCEEDTGEGCMPLGSDEFELEIIGNIYENPDLLTQPKQDE